MAKMTQKTLYSFTSGEFAKETRFSITFYSHFVKATRDPRWSLRAIVLWLCCPGNPSSEYAKTVDLI